MGYKSVCVYKNIDLFEDTGPYILPFFSFWDNSMKWIYVDEDEPNKMFFRKGGEKESFHGHSDLVDLNTQ